MGITAGIDYDALRLAGLKYCPECARSKRFNDFGRDTNHKSGFRAYCKECARARAKAKTIADGFSASTRWKWANKEKTDDARLKYRYCMTIAMRDAMAAKQNYRCAACKRERKLYIDHCHETARVRGLLCHKCNVALGMLDDSPLMVSQLMEYINGN